MALDPNRIEYLVVHCSYTPADMDVTAKDINRWHRQQGWLKIGYHFVIRRNGTVEKGRALSEVGAHVQGYNEKSIGICLIGGAKKVDGKLVDETNFTTEQMIALQGLLLKLKETFTAAEICGHNNLTPKKTCPTFDVKAWVASLPSTATPA